MDGKTLEELIVACGDEFGSVEQVNPELPEGVEGKYVTRKVTIENGKRYVEVVRTTFSKTPTEAVEKLYKHLTKTNA